MVNVNLFVITSEDGEQSEEYVTIELPGVPCVGELIITKGTEFKVRRVVWGEPGSVDLYVYNTRYGINFPDVLR
jgi:hypothetical protein